MASSPGSKRGYGCLALIILGLLIGGGQSVYTALSNRAPLEITCAEYLEKRPDAKWLKLKDCELSHLETLSKTFLGKPSTADPVFIPVRPVGTTDSKIHIILVSSRPADRDFAAQADAAKDPKSQRQFLLANLARAKERRDVEGLIRFGLDAGGNDREKLLRANNDLARDFIAIQDGEQPSMLQGAILFGGGIVGLLVLIGKGLGSKSSPSEPFPPAGPTGAPPIPPLPK